MTCQPKQVTLLQYAYNNMTPRCIAKQHHHDKHKQNLTKTKDIYKTKNDPATISLYMLMIRPTS